MKDLLLNMAFSRYRVPKSKNTASKLDIQNPVHSDRVCFPAYFGQLLMHPI